MGTERNLCEVSFLALSENESFARMAAAAFVLPLNPTVEELADIKTAVSEAVTNCIVHAYADSIGVITIHTKIFENRRIVIIVRDKGCGIESIEKAMEPLYTTAPEEDRATRVFRVLSGSCPKVSATLTP